MAALEFGQHLKRLRKDKGLTLDQLGEQLNLSKSYLSHIENGRRGTPNPELLKAFSSALGVNYNDLMAYAGYLDREDIPYKSKVVDKKSTIQKELDLSKLKKSTVIYKKNKLTEYELKLLKNFLDALISKEQISK